MKNVFVVIALAYAFMTVAGCTKAQVAASPILTSIADAGCKEETAALAGFAGSIAATLKCSNLAAIQSSLSAVAGNANFCALVPSAVASTSALKAMGVVGNIACPVVVNAIVGFATNSVPSAWGCSVGTSASALSTTLISICETAVPI